MLTVFHCSRNADIFEGIRIAFVKVFSSTGLGRRQYWALVEGAGLVGLSKLDLFASFQYKYLSNVVGYIPSCESEDTTRVNQWSHQQLKTTCKYSWCLSKNCLSWVTLNWLFLFLKIIIEKRVSRNKSDVQLIRSRVVQKQDLNTWLSEIDCTYKESLWESVIISRKPMERTAGSRKS